MNRRSFCSLPLASALAGAPSEPYRPEWESLKAHRDPAWFRDAKLGIYTHWGPVTVGAEDAPSGMEWYGNQMYLEKHAAFGYHRKTFGDQRTVGYKDVIPRFTAARFDAREWADLFSRAGAKFAGPVAIHHDNYAMWDSQVTRWNSKAIGPRRDITGELEKAIRARGMKFITTFHHGFAWRYYEPAYTFDAADGKNGDLYCEPHAKDAPPSERFLKTWLALVDEVLASYKPDLTWFDFELTCVITPEYHRLILLIPTTGPRARSARSGWRTSSARSTSTPASSILNAAGKTRARNTLGSPTPHSARGLTTTS